MWPFTPRYLKHAKLLYKGVSRFVNYKRDILPPTKLDQINALRADLKTAMKERDRAKIEKLHEEINDACNKALPNLKTSEIGDNVEVIFVAIVVALGIRAYIAQPFQIPTASMQPTLNGYNAEATRDDETPNIFKRAWDRLGGTSYVNVVSDHSGYLAQGNDYLTEHRFLLLWTYSRIHFADGHKIDVWCPLRQLTGRIQTLKAEDRGLGLYEYLNVPTRVATGADGKELLTPDNQVMRERVQGTFYVSKGQLLARGLLHTGDHILVNKFSYHFRRPERGEVFVFTTKNINAISVPPEQGSQHYIKRLVGVPGDTLEVKEPQLWINGQPATEPGIQRVAAADKAVGYRGYGAQMGLSPGESVTLQPQQYWAMGDNSFNSSDSRYWGHVPQRNIVGPALFSYLPFASHWGPIN